MVNKDIRQLKGYLNGRDAVVIGGSPKVKEEFALVPHGCYMIAANHHAADRDIVSPDMVVVLDKGFISKFRPKYPNSVMVGRDLDSDYVISMGFRKHIGELGVDWNSGRYAAAIAAFMGAKRIYVAGADCYQTIDPNVAYMARNRNDKYLAHCKSVWASIGSIADIVFMSEDMTL